MEVEWKNGIQHWTGMRQGAEGGGRSQATGSPLHQGNSRPERKGHWSVDREQQCPP